MIGHRSRSRRAVDLERLIALQHPRGEDQIRQAERMIGVQMGDEHVL